jgi:hypothetical protein
MRRRGSSNTGAIGARDTRSDHHSGRTRGKGYKLQEQGRCLPQRATGFYFGNLPALRLVASPANGTISIRRGKVTATNYQQCLALEVPGFYCVLLIQADFVGTGTAVIEGKYRRGCTELHASPSMPAPGGQKV